VTDRTLALAFALMLALAFAGGVYVGQRSQPADLSGYQQALDLGIEHDLDGSALR
jgi:hypothetical protein